MGNKTVGRNIRQSVHYANKLREYRYEDPDEKKKPQNDKFRDQDVNQKDDELEMWKKILEKRNQKWIEFEERKKKMTEPFVIEMDMDVSLIRSPGAADEETQPIMEDEPNEIHEQENIQNNTEPVVMPTSNIADENDRQTLPVDQLPEIEEEEIDETESSTGDAESFEPGEGEISSIDEDSYRVSKRDDGVFLTKNKKQEIDDEFSMLLMDYDGKEKRKSLSETDQYEGKEFDVTNSDIESFVRVEEKYLEKELDEEFNEKMLEIEKEEEELADREYASHKRMSVIHQRFSTMIEDDIVFDMEKIFADGRLSWDLGKLKVEERNLLKEKMEIEKTKKELEEEERKMKEEEESTQKELRNIDEKWEYDKNKILQFEERERKIKKELENVERTVASLKHEKRTGKKDSLTEDEELRLWEETVLREELEREKIAQEENKRKLKLGIIDEKEKMRIKKLEEKDAEIEKSKAILEKQLEVRTRLEQEKEERKKEEAEKRKKIFEQKKSKIHRMEMSIVKMIASKKSERRNQARNRAMKRRIIKHGRKTLAEEQMEKRKNMIKRKLNEEEEMKKRAEVLEEQRIEEELMLELEKRERELQEELGIKIRESYDGETQNGTVDISALEKKIAQRRKDEGEDAEEFPQTNSHESTSSDEVDMSALEKKMAERRKRDNVISEDFDDLPENAHESTSSDEVDMSALEKKIADRRKRDNVLSDDFIDLSESDDFAKKTQKTPRESTRSEKKIGEIAERRKRDSADFIDLSVDDTIEPDVFYEEPEIATKVSEDSEDAVESEKKVEELVQEVEKKENISDTEERKLERKRRRKERRMRMRKRSLEVYGETEKGDAKKVVEKKKKKKEKISTEKRKIARRKRRERRKRMRKKENTRDLERARASVKLKVLADYEDEEIERQKGMKENRQKLEEKKVRVRKEREAQRKRKRKHLQEKWEKKVRKERKRNELGRNKRTEKLAVGEKAEKPRSVVVKKKAKKKKRVQRRKYSVPAKQARVGSKKKVSKLRRFWDDVKVRKKGKRKSSIKFKDKASAMKQIPKIQYRVNEGKNVKKNGRKSKVLFLIDGDYTGEMSDSRIPHGTGTMRYESGSKYVGSFRNGQRDGRGIFFNRRGEKVFEGSWSANGFSKGIRYFPNGEKYAGQFDYNTCLFHGRGEYTYNTSPEFRKYSGGWKLGAKEGDGILFFNDGTSIETIWKNNKIMKIVNVRLVPGTKLTKNK